VAKPRTCFVHEKPWRRLILVVHLRYRCGACARCGGSRTILARMRHEHCGGRSAKAARCGGSCYWANRRPTLPPSLPWPSQ
jgi:hypothetical protein